MERREIPWRSCADGFIHRQGGHTDPRSGPSFGSRVGFAELETEQYFGLDETGTRMWQLVTGSPNIDAAYQELLAEFDVEPELLRSNLMDLLSRLVDSGLLQVLPADVGTAPAV